MIFFIVAFALIGLLGMTWACPVIARSLWTTEMNWAKHYKAKDVQVETRLPTSFAILIPAHNEADRIEDTIISIGKSVRKAKEAHPKINFFLMVGADGCIDQTAEIARGLHVEVLEFKERSGKWTVINKLIEESSPSDWVILADVGTEWREDLLERAIPLASQSDVMGIAPAYYLKQGSSAEESFWELERHLKQLTVPAGGPISVHGATVLYRRKQLEAALTILKNDIWINDDVVIPLVMRMTNPNGKIHYDPRIAIQDLTPDSQSGSSIEKELNQRHRMLIGNLQWMRELLPLAFRENTSVGFFALRRVFRLLGAYWFFLLFLSFGLLIEQITGLVWVTEILLLATISVAAILYSIDPGTRRMLNAIIVSFSAPYYFFKYRKEDTKNIDWGS